MSHPPTIEVLLAIAVLTAMASCVGMLVMRDAYQRLHYLSPAASITPILIMIAVLLQEGLKQAGIKMILTIFASRRSIRCAIPLGPA